MLAVCTVVVFEFRDGNTTSMQGSAQCDVMRRQRKRLRNRRADLHSGLCIQLCRA